MLRRRSFLFLLGFSWALYFDSPSAWNCAGAKNNFRIPTGKDNFALKLTLHACFSWGTDLRLHRLCKICRLCYCRAAEPWQANAALDEMTLPQPLADFTALPRYFQKEEQWVEAINQAANGLEGSMLSQGARTMKLS